MPSEKGSRLSTSSSSASPPSVIIWYLEAVITAAGIIHLFQLESDLVEAAHKHIQSLLAELVVLFALAVSLLGDLVQFFLSLLHFTILLVVTSTISCKGRRNTP